MNNKGGVSGGAPGENGSLFGVQEIVPDGNEQKKFKEFLDEREDLKPRLEMPAELVDNDNSAEVSGEMQPTEQAAPAAPPSVTPVSDDNQKNQAVKVELEKIEVARDAENLPKAYESAVTEIVNRNRKDPFRLVQEMDIARWDLMGKAFDRKLGDGLNGGGNS